MEIRIRLAPVNMKTVIVNKGFTLVELLIVILIIGILAAISIPNYSKLKERTLDKEAKAMLKLMQAAEKIYRMEYITYYPEKGKPPIEDESHINKYLKLSLPTGGSKNWEFKAYDNGTVSASRGGRTWTLYITEEEPRPE